MTRDHPTISLSDLGLGAYGCSLTAVHRVKRLKVAERVVVASDLADDRPVDLQLVDLAESSSSRISLVGIRGAGRTTTQFSYGR